MIWSVKWSELLDKLSSIVWITWHTSSWYHMVVYGSCCICHTIKCFWEFIYHFEIKSPNKEDSNSYQKIIHFPWGHIWDFYNVHIALWMFGHRWIELSPYGWKIGKCSKSSSCSLVHLEEPLWRAKPFTLMDFRINDLSRGPRMTTVQ